jgi:hypothetical protein
MKRLFITFLLAGMTSPAPAADWTMIRRIGQAAGCAVSMIDARTSLRSGLAEENPSLGSGRPQSGRMIGIKAGVCAAEVAYAEWRHHKRSWQQIGPVHNIDVRDERVTGIASFTAAAAYGAVAAHNASITTK